MVGQFYLVPVIAKMDVSIVNIYTIGIDRDTVKNYINDPQRKFKRSAAPNLKLDPFRQLIDKWLEEDKEVKAPVVLQRLHENGFDGQITIVRDYLLQLRGPQKKTTGVFAVRITAR